MYIIISHNYREVFRYSQEKCLLSHMMQSIIGGQPVHDAIAKLHDAIIGGKPVHGAIAKILSVSVILPNQN